MRLCAIVPAFNAAATLGVLLESLAALPYSVLVVDDGSSDATSAIARGFSDRGVVLIRHDANQGKGAALRTGFKWAVEQGFDAAVTMDSDLQHSPADLPGLIEVFEREGLDVLVGSRVHDQGDMPRSRRFGNWFSSWIATRFCHQVIPDSQCGYRLFRVARCRRMFEQLRLARFDGESEVFVRASLNLLRIGFAPITVIYPTDASHRSYYRPWEDTTRIVYMYVKELLRRTFTVKGRRELRELKRYVQGRRDRPGYRLLPRAR
jgi:glycosyltransferase involved in cell wall biosynthesis